MANIITCNAELYLDRHNGIYDTKIQRLPTRDKLPAPIVKKLTAYCKQQVENPEHLYMHLFYSGSPAMRGCALEILKPVTMHEINGRFVFRTKVCYYMATPITVPDLRKEIHGIFDHWYRAGDVAFGYKKLEVLSTKLERSLAVSKGTTIYHNMNEALCGK